MQAYLTHTFDSDDFDLVSVIDELPLWSAPFGLKLLDTIKLKSGINVLDIGSGLGFPLLEIAQRLGTTSTVYGIQTINKDSFKMSFVDAGTMFNHSLIKYWFLDSWKNILKPTDLEDIFARIEKSLNETATQKGEIQLTIPFVTIDCLKK